MCRYLLEDSLNKTNNLFKSICSKYILETVTDFPEHLAEKAKVFFNLLMMQYSILKKIIIF